MQDDPDFILLWLYSDCRNTSLLSVHLLQLWDPKKMVNISNRFSDLFKMFSSLMGVLCDGSFSSYNGRDGTEEWLAGWMQKNLVLQVI